MSQNQGGYTSAMNFIGGVGRQDMKHNDLQAFSRDFGILPGSEEETKAIVSGRVRNWTMSQLGKGKPSEYRFIRLARLFAETRFAWCRYCSVGPFREARTQYLGTGPRAYGIVGWRRSHSSTSRTGSSQETDCQLGLSQLR